MAGLGTGRLKPRSHGKSRAGSALSGPRVLEHLQADRFDGSRPGIPVSEADPVRTETGKRRRSSRLAQPRALVGNPRTPAHG